MPQESHLEMKVGAFVFAGLVVLTVIIWSITDTSVIENGKSLKVIFGFANGLKKNAPVRIAGVDEGIVKDVSLFFDRQDGRTKAEVALWVKKETQVPQDSVITINQLGLLGEKYIEIVPGIDSKAFFQDGQMVTGKDPIAQEAISEKVLQVAHQVEQSIGGLSKIIQDESNQQSISKTIQNLGTLTGHLSEISANVKAGEGTVGKLLYDSQLYNNLEGMTADLKENPWKLLYRPKTKK